MLANKIYKAFKAVKTEEARKAASNAADAVSGYAQVNISAAEEREGFQLSIFAMNKYWTPEQKVTKNTSIKNVVHIYK
eukprot:UN02864